MRPFDKHRWIGWRRQAAPLLLVLAVMVSAPARANEALTYDANGNVQTRTLPGGTTTFGYDDLDRLTGEAGPAKTQNLTYDPNGNRTTDGAGTITYAPNTDRPATINGVPVSLDAAGNITAARGYTYLWNQAGQLKSVRKGSQLTAYYYDYQGRRTRKVLAGGSQAFGTTLYTYDAQNRLTGELDGDGTPLRTYVWRDTVPVAIILHGRYGEPESVLYLETDHLGTPIAASNMQGTVVWRWESDAFGATMPNEDPDGDGFLTTINLRFPGQYFDKESGLYYNWHRYYDPKLGRYLSPDPIGLAGGVNLYTYVNGNPISYTDPRGLWVPQAIGAAVGGVSGLIQTGNAVGWSWSNAGTIATGGAVGAAFGAVGTLSIGTGLSAAATGMWAGGTAVFFGNIGSQIVVKPSLAANPSCIDYRQAAFQGFIGLGSGYLGAAAYGPYPVANPALASSVVSGGAQTILNLGVSTNLGGFGAENIVQ